VPRGSQRRKAVADVEENSAQLMAAAEVPYCDSMRNITVSLDDETYRRARMIAAERDTSLSALVKHFLVGLASGETEFERLKRLEQEARARVVDFTASGRLSRDEIHERRY
jgi:hypothetical protein